MGSGGQRERSVGRLVVRGKSRGNMLKGFIIQLINIKSEFH